MASMLAVRRQQADSNYVIPRSLLKQKEGLTFYERLWAYQEWLIWFPMQAFFFVVLLALSISTEGATGPVIAACVTGTTTLVAFFIAINTSIEGYTTKRKKYLIEDRARRLAPQASERRERANDVKYNQYTVEPMQDGTSIKFYVVEHSDPTLNGLIYKTHKRTRKGFNAVTGDWRGETAAILSEPTLESVQEALAKWQEVAAELERTSYNEALKRREVKHIVLQVK